ncbi:MAG: MFS transporter [Anaerolineales bacterium]|nr:MFS transporter [Anaerolineales bacterium]
MPQQRHAWLVMLAVFLAGVVVALNQSKVPPVMPVLLAEFQMDTPTGGWLMSSFAVAGVILSLPAAALLAGLGPKRAGLIALGCTVLGSTAGALAPSATGLLLARVIEGVGLGLIAVIAPSIISMWFQPQDRGAPMGLWAAWVPLGGFIVYNLSGPLTAAFGWQGLWWFGALSGVMAFGVYAAVVDAPPAAAGRARVETPLAAGLALAVRSPSVWLLALTFGTFTFASTGHSTWNPSYLEKALGLAPQAASFTASLTMLAVIPATLTAGWLLDRTRQRGRVLTMALLAWGLLFLLSFRLPGRAPAALYMLVLGFTTGFIPTTIFTLTPEALPRPELAGWAIGLVSVGQNLGMFLGPPTVGAAIKEGQWSAGVAPLVLAVSIGVAASLALQRGSAPGARLAAAPPPDAAERAPVETQ